MFDKYECLESSEKNVWKYIFTKEDAIAEAVLYKYDTFYTRTVICCSTMSGCPVGCTFCGTGKKFIKNLTALEIVQQIENILADKSIKDVDEVGDRFQIMFMSMGEPMLNWEETEKAIRILHDLYPNAELLISTIGVDDNYVFDRIIELSKDIDKVGLQFSIHKSNDKERSTLIPYRKKMSLRKLRDAATVWWVKAGLPTGRRPYLNYCVDGTNCTKQDYEELTSLFSPMIFNFTFSVVCSADETMKEAGFRNLERVTEFCDKFTEAGYNTRIFDPAGQDDIGGGCGQLWHVQKWMKDHKKEEANA